MRLRNLFVLTAAFAMTLTALQAANASPARTLNLPESPAASPVFDDTEPDVTARVARISFIKGDVQIKRVGSQDWERATLNLPIVEGDELTTSGDARIEIQFNRNTHLRLAENSYLKITKLMDEGIALSLPQGTVTVRATEFDKTRSYLEFDAPGSTIAVQRSGTYRIDTGDKNETEVRVIVTSGGEARIYSETSGFVLKNGRSARVFVSGGNAGEWETGDAARYADEFDSWSLDRDRTIARSMQNAHYDKYYDQDIYGAEDLDDYGQWVHTRNYGYVWRPHRNSVNSYANWSPYRYGQWRWIPPYGWTWVNDEPWGWATYHHGRWLYDDGFWYWSPYGQYRYSRSWWSPALVIITTYAGNICWYPLPYSYNYYNYNYYYNSHNPWGGHNNGGGNNTGTVPVPLPSPTRLPPIIDDGPGRSKIKRPPLGTVPPTGVVTVKSDEFGQKPTGTRMPPLSVATQILKQSPGDGETPPILPNYEDVKVRGNTGVATAKPRIIATAEPIVTGAATRKSAAPLDEELRTTKVFGGRLPVVTNTEPAEPTKSYPGSGDTRKTGAVDRQPPIRSSEPTETKQPTVKVREPQSEPTRQPPVYSPPTSDEPTKPREPVRQPPRYDPPQYDPPPRYDPPPTRQPPRYDPPPKQDPPPTRQPPKQDSPPPKSEPKPDKPAPAKASEKPDNDS